MTLTNEQDLWLRFKEHGDQAARDQLVIEYMRIVKYVAGRMAIHVPSTIELDDLIGWGVLGLMDAVEKFDPKQNIKFSTYSTIRVRGAILDQIRSLDWAPRSLRQMARRIGQTRDTLRQEEGREPSHEAIAQELGLTPDQVEDCMTQLQTAQILSLDDYLPAEDGDHLRKVDIVVDNAIKSPDRAALDREKRERLVKAILELPEQQQKVLHLYYYEELTLKEIGAVLEVTESRVCQVHSAALKRLRQAAYSEA